MKRSPKSTARWGIAFSKDKEQKYIFLADGKNEHIYVIDRQSLEILTMLGDGGRQPGQWFAEPLTAHRWLTGGLV